MVSQVVVLQVVMVVNLQLGVDLLDVPEVPEAMVLILSNQLAVDTETNLRVGVGQMDVVLQVLNLPPEEVLQVGMEASQLEGVERQDVVHQ